MAEYIDVMGVGADGVASLKEEQVERIGNADFLAGGERHLADFQWSRAEKFVIKDNLNELVAALNKRHPDQSCVVLASGDPLFYGIGTSLVTRLEPTQLRIEPAVSSMQLAFARARVPWQDAVLASIHGRSVKASLLPLLGKRRIGLFTLNGDSPATIAHFFLAHGLNDYEAIVGENLGTAQERVTRWPELRTLTNHQFTALNYLVMRRTKSPLSIEQIELNRSHCPGIPDDVFARPEEGPDIMSRQEVRSVLLAKLAVQMRAAETFWDIGAGLGTVAVEMAILRPQIEVVAVERDPNRAGFLRQNRERFDTYNIRIIGGAAPEALAKEKDRPRLVFVGGSSSQLPAILDFVQERLLPGGRLVANFVTLENLMTMLQRVQSWKWSYDVTEVHIARGDSLAGLTSLKPQRGIFIIAADKPNG
ncbi:MAG: precorrin-6y C5,15-methyltransferase (decarboxylating) subunit CbiE [Gemmataceae bacterium]